MTTTLGRLTERNIDGREREKKSRVKRDRKSLSLREKKQRNSQTEISINSTDRKINKTDADRKREGEANCIS